MAHSDDQFDFGPDDDLLMHQEIMLLKIKNFENSSMTDEDFKREEKEIRKNIRINIGHMIINVQFPNIGCHK